MKYASIVPMMDRMWIGPHASKMCTRTTLRELQGVA